MTSRRHRRLARADAAGLQLSREPARRCHCINNLKQIGLALHNYGQAYKVFPPGTVCTSDPIQPSNQYDVLAEAAQTAPGRRAPGFCSASCPSWKATLWEDLGLDRGHLQHEQGLSGLA